MHIIPYNSKEILLVKYVAKSLQQLFSTETVPTLISLINVEPTLTDFEKFHPPQNKNPPSSFIDFLDFSTLHSSFIRFYVLVFSKNSTLLVYSKLHV